MSRRREELVITVYAPGLESGDTRPVAVVRGMERAFPGLNLDWSVSESNQLIFLQQRDAWVMQPQDPDEGFPLVCNGDETYPITLSGQNTPAGRLTPTRQSQFTVHAALPLDERAFAAAADVLEALAEQAHAQWGLAAPGPTLRVAAEQVCHSPRQPARPPHGLPVIKMPWELRSPDVPHSLGWLNYWSAAAARLIGFPDHPRDAELLSRSRRTPTGGWIVRLTDAPLDLGNPTHIQALLNAYARFPEIGGRASP